ncbi:MAG: beta-N-acetylglucosaminidase domain-containing protein [Verrucomicrobia bacterium]|nr:beta-N-acetylglucosaminidase domain-containing protein [Verrucomicrobiota bacterium]MBI3868144.1 beta-N-acetylglucosaminidase domain-containing protein [Verrucomicrobiota bacterium]
MQTQKTDETASPSQHAPLWGVVEGFYGRPWTAGQRESLCAWMKGQGLNAYLYAPKDDLKHRALWHAAYTRDEARALKRLIAHCDRLGVRFIYGIAPGLSTRWTPKQVESLLLRKVESVRRLGCRSFALMFDDIPSKGAAQYLRRYGSWVNAHVAWSRHVIEGISKRQPDARFLFCPTPYCGSFAGDVAQNTYLRTIGEDLPNAVDILWTGSDIIAPSIGLAEIRAVARVLRRPPTIWDNWFANDYDLRRLHLGPYAKRDPRVRREVRGILINPNTEFRANDVPFHTFASFVRGGGGWSEESAYRDALDQWRPQFRDCRGALPTRKELRTLTDCLHLPFASGKLAAKLLRDLPSALASTTSAGHAARARIRKTARALLQWQTRITELRDRELSYTLYRHVWELKEEMDLFQRYFDWMESATARRSAFRSPFHQVGTYRGGFVASLQRHLELAAAGGFRPATRPVS